MSKLLVVAMGGVLVLAGAVAMWLGWDIVQVERGWASVIAGATASSAGVVVIAIGILIGELRRLQASSAPAVARARSNDEPSAPRPAASEPQDRWREAEPEVATAPRDESVARMEPAPQAPRFSRPEPLLPESPLPEPPRVEAAVVGRYAFGGANYALYDDGSIEAETPAGLRRFASLAELREYIAERER